MKASGVTPYSFPAMESRSTVLILPDTAQMRCSPRHSFAASRGSQSSIHLKRAEDERRYAIAYPSAKYERMGLRNGGGPCDNLIPTLDYRLAPALRVRGTPREPGQHQKRR